MQIAAAGDRALLVTLGDVTAAELHARAAAMRAAPHVIACVPGHSSLLIVFDGTPDVGQTLLSVPTDKSFCPTTHEIPVHFDGVDLDEFLTHTKQTLDAFLERVPDLCLTARYLGFRAGFAYLDGWPREWAMPRRATSRPVRRGSFAIAGDVAGFYPIDSPGGWNILGTTDVELENRFRAGDEVRIRVAEWASRRVENPPMGNSTTRPLADSTTLLFGPLATIVTPADWSRVERGLPEGGPFDDVAFEIVRAAVTNPIVLECPMSAPRIRYHEKKTVAWFDGELRIERIEGEHSFGKVKHGLRGYLAIGDGPTDQPTNGPTRADRNVIQAIAGPHAIGLEQLECDVTPKLDRVGIRMTPLQRIDVAIPADLKSCGMLCGTVQLHPDGSIVAMGPDHPITGGYLMPMTVISSERWKLAQLSPGERVTFVVTRSPSSS